MTPTDTPLTIIDRPGGASLRLEIVQSKARPLVELSLWSTRIDGSTYQVPGKVIGIRGDELLSVIEALRDATRELRLRGDLP